MRTYHICSNNRLLEHKESIKTSSLNQIEIHVPPKCTTSTNVDQDFIPNPTCDTCMYSVKVSWVWLAWLGLYRPIWQDLIDVSQGFMGHCATCTRYTQWHACDPVFPYKYFFCYVLTCPYHMYKIRHIMFSTYTTHLTQVKRKTVQDILASSTIFCHYQIRKTDIR